MVISGVMEPYREGKKVEKNIIVCCLNVQIVKFYLVVL